jgi:anthranilate phosphoribosyltransferase
MASLSSFISQLQSQDLSRAESRKAFTAIMKGGCDEGEIAAFLLALKEKGETPEEITGAAEALRKMAGSLNAPEGAIDTCGTGGDAKGTYNISTATAIVVAACGIPVAKHGNRSVSSKSGSADVLETLGVNLNASIPTLERCLEEANICFMMAPQFHPAMKHVAPVRAKLKTRTIFNLLGPLLNPAKTPYQLLGVYDKQLADPMVRVLKELGTERAWVVHGQDGLDELTITGESYVASLSDGRISSFLVTPEDAGLPRADINDIVGGDAQENASAIQALFQGEQGAYRNAVLLNAGAALVIAGAESTIKDAAARAARAIDSGSARKTLSELVKWSNDG